MDHANTLDTERVPFLSSTEIFHDIDPAALLDLATQVEELHLEAGETLIRQGDPSDAMYLIVSGQVGVLDVSPGHPEKLLAQLGPGQAVGELALWTGGVRSATVRTVSPVRALKLTREGFERFAKDHPEAVEAVDRFVGLRLRKDRLAVALEVSGMFGDLAEPTLRELEAELESEWIEAGTTLFRQGDPGDALYLVVSGRLRVSVDLSNEDPRFVTELGCGETVGEMALLDGKPRSATVVATRDSHLARLSKEAFERLSSRHPELLAVIAREAGGAPTNARPSAWAPPTLEHDPRGGAGVAGHSDPGILRAACAAPYRPTSPTLLLGSALLDTYLGKPGAAQATEHQAGHGRIIELLSKLETDHRYLIYQADASDSLWSRLCLRQCDHILIVGDAARDPREDAEAYVTSALNRPAWPAREFGVASSGLRQTTLRDQCVARRKESGPALPLRPDSDSDFGRMARCLTGRAVGLVLSGGGIRGAGHAGVIRALREAGVPIDIVGGTSAGAAVAAAAALEHDHEWMVHAIMTACLTMSKDWTIPLVSLLSGQKFDDCFYGLVGKTQIEDLWLPFFCCLGEPHARQHPGPPAGFAAQESAGQHAGARSLPAHPLGRRSPGGRRHHRQRSGGCHARICGLRYRDRLGCLLRQGPLRGLPIMEIGFRAGEPWRSASNRLRKECISLASSSVLMRIIELGSAARKTQTSQDGRSVPYAAGRGLRALPSSTAPMRWRKLATDTPRRKSRIGWRPRPGSARPEQPNGPNPCQPDVPWMESPLPALRLDR